MKALPLDRGELSCLIGHSRNCLFIMRQYLLGHVAYCNAVFLYMRKIRHLLHLKQVPDNINYSEEPKSSTTI